MVSLFHKFTSLTQGDEENRARQNTVIRHLKQDDAFNRTWGGQFFQLISLLPGNTYQLKKLAATSCWRRRHAFQIFFFCGRPPPSRFFVNMAVTWSKVLLNGIYSDNNRLSKKMVLLKVVAQKILFLTVFYSNWYEKICSTTFFAEAALWWILLWFIFTWAGWWLKPPNSLQITQIHKLWLLQLNMSLKASFLYVFKCDERWKIPEESRGKLINF